MSTQAVTFGTRASDYANGIQSTEEMIRLRAYQLYEERGRQDGWAEYDWQQAECHPLPAGGKKCSRIDPQDLGSFMGAQAQAGGFLASLFSV
jgi:Protein of unknown function (DUF2934)